MIQLSGAGKRYGPRILFENVDWLVTPTERAGLVGANGTGKSSLLKVLAGLDSLDSDLKTVRPQNPFRKRRLAGDAHRARWPRGRQWHREILAAQSAGGPGFARFRSEDGTAPESFSKTSTGW